MKGLPMRHAVFSDTPSLPDLPGSRLLSLLVALAAAAWVQTAPALDPPHDASNSIDCDRCHIAPHSAAGSISNVLGNVNLCLSCHLPGGHASLKSLLVGDQALPWPGLPTNVAPSGTSHRWDSGLAGHVAFLGGAATQSSGRVVSGGDFTGRVAKTYTLTITQSGSAGIARFNWTGTQPGGGGGAGTNVICGTGVPLDLGVLVSFSNGLPSPSFRAGDRWNIYVRTDTRAPTNALLQGVLSGGLLACSMCHDQHSQTNAPFDPSAPAYAGAGTGLGRHFQRIDNSACQLCVDCHAARNVTNSAAGSHPVGMVVPASGFFKSPTNLPLQKTVGKVWCLTCHDTHNSGSDDGDLLRIANRRELCTSCHTLADTATPAAHLNSTNNVLWPGGQYGSTFPQRTDVAQRGTCVNCHAPHGWPDTANPSQDYPGLLVEREENLCFTCHDTNGPALKAVKDDFVKTVHHPVVDTDPLRRAGRSVECIDCHSTHKALSGAHVYTNTATSARNQVSNPNKGVEGVVVDYTGLGNFVAPGPANYTLTNNATYVYQICFKCHSSYAWGTNAPPTGISANGSVTNPVETDLAQNFSPMNRSGHPIVTGLDNYVNSTAVGSPARRGLQPAAMKAPWNVNVGQQTMTCSDCHDSDATLPAAQGPHGSAARFMLSGANATNWPSLTLGSSAANFANSWCANCHNSVNNVHTRSNHSSRTCNQCHIVVPHGGKLSRLIADNDTMPNRYAYNNALSLSNLRSFTKKAASSYQDTDCQAGCTGTHSGGASENW
jgi:predicted CXXCH cytochrome family protein